MEPPPPQKEIGITANMRGIHASAGGWSPLDKELDLVKRSNIKFALIVSYENQPQAIARFKSAGVEKFIIRAAVHDPIKDGQVDRFVEKTLPILKNYAANIDTPLIIAIGNEPNLYQEGAGTWWQDGATFAQWWLKVAAKYRAELPGCLLGFPAMSPGGQTKERMDEEDFIYGAKKAIAAADWIGVHYYWEKSDGSDINPPLTLWRKWFGNKVVVGTEVGVANNTVVTRGATTWAFEVFRKAGYPIAAWVLSGAGAWTNAAWDKHDIVVG